jgi:hypothetical protein
MSLKKTFNFEKTFQQEKIAIGRETDTFYHHSWEIDRKVHREAFPIPYSRKVIVASRIKNGMSN